VFSHRSRKKRKKFTLGEIETKNKADNWFWLLFYGTDSRLYLSLRCMHYYISCEGRY
jgi:hypothetical protein